jgi:hypothetical protein
MTNNSKIDPKYLHGGGKGWMEEQESDTPRTDAAIELDGITNDHVVRALRIFGREKMTKDGSLESWINLGADRLEKAEAEVERLTKLLSLEREGHEGTKKLCAKILDSTRKTPSMEWHRKNRKVLLK